MNRQESLDNIMNLMGVDEFKTLIDRLDTFLQNKEKLSLDINLHNYLWVVKPGGGTTTLCKAFAEYLFAAKAIKFAGNDKFFEFKMSYTAPESVQSELKRFENAITVHAGYRRYYKGVVCIDISEWQKHIDDVQFKKFLDYIAINNDKWLVIFCVNTEDRSTVDAIELALSFHMQIESLTLKLPDAKDLVNLVESRIQSEGLSLTARAKDLLLKTIEGMSAGKHFKGNRVASIENNRILDNYGKWIYEIRGDRVYDTYGNWIYEVRGSRVYDTYGNWKYEIRAGRIYDTYGNWLC